MMRRFHVLMLAALAAYSAACTAVETHPKADRASLNFFGTTYPHTCTPSENRKLRRELDAIAPPQRREAWKVIDTILCGTGPGQRQRLFNLLAPMVCEADDESSCENPDAPAQQRMIDHADFLVGDGAWNTTLSIDTFGRLWLSWAPNGGCIRSATLELENKTWRVVALVAI